MSPTLKKKRNLASFAGSNLIHLSCPRSCFFPPGCYAFREAGWWSSWQLRQSSRWQGQRGHRWRGLLEPGTLENSAASLSLSCCLQGSADSSDITARQRGRQYTFCFNYRRNRPRKYLLALDVFFFESVSGYIACLLVFLLCLTRTRMRLFYFCAPAT